MVQFDREPAAAIGSPVAEHSTGHRQLEWRESAAEAWLYSWNVSTAPGLVTSTDCPSVCRS